MNNGDEGMAARAAYAALPSGDRAMLDRMVRRLHRYLHQRYPAVSVGRSLCLEIIAAIGQALNEECGRSGGSAAKEGDTNGRA